MQPKQRLSHSRRNLKSEKKRTFESKVSNLKFWKFLFEYKHPGNYSLCFETLFPGTLPWPLGKVLGRKLCVLIKMAKLYEHSYTGVQHILHT